MFYCNDCAEKNGYPETLCKSEGKCEICGKHAMCNDTPSGLLPMPPTSSQDKGCLRKISDDSVEKPCLSNMHNPPMYMYLEPGTYEWTCPSCGKITVFSVPSITNNNGWFGKNKGNITIK